jgi:diphthine synthase
MTLYLIGLGLDSEKDISVKALETIRKCESIYLEDYTSKLNCSVSAMEKLYGKPVILASRNLVEQKAEDTILKEAKKTDVALLVVGDPFGATTHSDIYLRAKELGIKVKILHNTSILNAIGATGLELYKFGKTTSIPYPQPSFFPETAYDVIKDNQKLGLHTLCLLDIKALENRYMSVNEAIEILMKIEKKRGEKIFLGKTFCVGCARVGADDMVIKSGTAKELLNENFGKPLHCLIIPGKMHFIEEDMLKMWNQK